MRPIMADGTFKVPNSGLTSSRLDAEGAPSAKVEKRPNIFEAYLKKTGQKQPPRRDQGPAVK
jgi:hypothetical protein